MDQKKLITENILKLIHSEQESRIFPGCVIGIVKRDEQKFTFPFGHFTYEKGAQEVTRDAIYDVASITKAIPTSCLALKLIEEKKFSLDEKLISIVPEYQGSFRNEITLKHLLTQTLSFSFSLSSMRHESTDYIMKRIMHAELIDKPGKNYNYSNATSILLGLMIEKAGGKTLDVLADAYFFKPLHMQNTTFSPSRFPVASIVPTEIVDKKMIQGVVHDESARILSAKTVVGSAGLFSTADDLLIFLNMLLSGGVSQGRRIFEPATVAAMCEGVVIGDKQLGLGWESNSPWMGTVHSEKIIGKTGFTGCFIFCDMEKGIGLVHLSNHIFPQRKTSRESINRFRANLIDSVLTVLS